MSLEGGRADDGGGVFREEVFDDEDPLAELV